MSSDPALRGVRGAFEQLYFDLHWNPAVPAAVQPLEPVRRTPPSRNAAVLL